MSNWGLLEDIFFNPKFGLHLSSKKLRQKAKEVKGVKVSKKEADEFLSKQELSQRFKQKKVKKSQYDHIVSLAVFHKLQADLLDVHQLWKQNGGVRWLFNIVDIHSRYAWVYPIKNKTSAEVTRAFDKFLQENQKHDNYPPAILQTDNGKEFINRPFQQLLSKHNIKHNLNRPGDHKAQSIIERFNKTIRTMIERYLDSRNTLKYINVLDDLIYNYNHSIHSTTKNKPVDVFTLEEPNLQRGENSTPSLETGDLVRIKVSLGLFEKGTKARWSKELYNIVRKVKNSYVVADENGKEKTRRYKHYELLKVPKSVFSLGSERSDTAAEKEREDLRSEQRQQRQLNREDIRQESILTRKKRNAQKPERFRRDYVLGFR